MFDMTIPPPPPPPLISCVANNEITCIVASGFLVDRRERNFYILSKTCSVLGALDHLLPKFEHIFVAVITFSPFLLCR